ncbi:HalD/BesD family halogenase [Roseibium sp. SCP14]|uniref:HalD/BesD family halogenase n=1 Tax=Roseibium sp. SCP14 TaxID=3141375 RepID=UPI00333CD650
MEMENVIDLNAYPIANINFRTKCRLEFERTGVLVLPGFVPASTIEGIRDEGLANRDKVYAKTEQHTVYLSAKDPGFDDDHPRNRMVTSSKGCITDDLMPENSALRALYDSELFRDFLCEVLGEQALYEYADPLSSLNLHFAEKGQELGWHFDNSSFSITLMVQPPEAGGQFEYVTRLRDADSGDMNYEGVADVLDGQTKVSELSVEAGTLVFFRGRNSIHRVAPNLGDRTRILAVLAYNTEPGIALSKEAQLTFYGRTA